MKQVDKDIAGAIYSSSTKMPLIPLDKKPESIITKSLMATDGTRVEITYSEKDKKTSAYILDIDKKERIEIKLEDMPRDLREIKDPEVFNAFLRNVYTNTRIMSDGGVSLEVSQRLLGGMMSRAAACAGAGDGGGARVPEELVMDTIRLTEAGLGRIDTSDSRAVIVIGRTGVGKSTLINLLAGNRLVGVFDDDTGTMRIDAPEPLHDFKIGHRVASETAIPNKWRSPDGVVFWDCPGLLDNRGEAQEIASAVFIKKLFGTPQIKIIIMVNEFDLRDIRAAPMIDLIGELEGLFAGDISRIENSMSLLISNVQESTTIEKIQARIREIVKDAPGLNDVQKKILAVLAKNPISILRTPVAEGTIDVATIRGEIATNIDAVRYAEAIHAEFAISPSAKHVAVASYNELNNYIEKNVREFTESFRDSLKQFSTKSTDKAQLQKIATKLNEVMEMSISSAQEIRGMIERCRGISKVCGTDIRSIELDDALGKIEFLQFLEQFIDESSKIPLLVVRNVKDHAVESKVTVEKAIQLIRIKELSVGSK